eukprot:TRINITY_DN1971_c0_g1_i1.p1 TRINITY_DN1971_c0_g1~~TRINITY_DN1971_c0_g1_i1.p1  ORF type:complete len:518 (+),score=75.08 TRINITY_DN1971_c0_g1_i1:194-1747(+)
MIVRHRRKRLHRQQLLLLLLLLALPQQGRSGPPADPDPCAGLQDSAAVQCCARAIYDIAEAVGNAALTTASNSIGTYEAIEAIPRTISLAPGDAVYLHLIDVCLRRKAEILATEACAAVKARFRHTADSCTLTPYMDLRYMLRAGLLPEPPPPSSISKECRKERFLLWTRNVPDHGAGHSHKWFSMACAFWEARSLNRTLVLDSFTGMDKIHSGGAVNAEVPYIAWYTLTPLEQMPHGGLLYHQFQKGCGAPGMLSEADGDVAILPSGATHADMLALADVPLLVRNWEQPSDFHGGSAGHKDLASTGPALQHAHLTSVAQGRPELKYGFQVCHRPEAPKDSAPHIFKEPGVDYSMPDGFWKRIYSHWVYAISGSIMSQVRFRSKNHGMAVCLHVRRGDKVTKPHMEEKYPNLNYDTSPEGILHTIAPHVPSGSVLYIATNEEDPVAFFAPLEAHYTVMSVSHFPWLLRAGDFMPSTLALVDYTLLKTEENCARLIPTFASEESRGFDTHISLSPLHK